MTNKEFKKLKNDLWLAANKLRADSDLKSNDYSTPVLGIIFLKFADIKYSKFEPAILEEYKNKKDTRLEEPIEKIAIEKCGLYLPVESRYNYLMELSTDKEIDKAVIAAMNGIEKYVTALKDTLPKNEFFGITRKGQTLLKQLLKLFSTIPEDTTGDLLGKIYEFFLEKFGLEEAQKGGEFFTPTSVVNLMVEYIEPYYGKIFDPACGSGGMFVQSNNFIIRHHLQKGSISPISVYGQEKTLETVNLAKMNLAINGLRGEVRQGDSYAEDLYDSYGKFDFVMANPPFNVKEVNEDTVKKDKRFKEYGLPKSKSKNKKDGVVNIPNANYLWISLFATSLNDNGRAALVMANSASDAGHSEFDIRKTLVRKGIITGMLTLPSNMFSTVTLPATLWFFDKSKQIHDFEKEKSKIEILFVDARNVFHQIDRAHREFTTEQLQNLAAIQRLRKDHRTFFVGLVHNHYQNAFDRFPVLRKIITEITEQLKQQITAFKNWGNELVSNYNILIDNSKENLVLNPKQFFDELNQITVSNPESVLLLLNIATDAFQAHQKKLKIEDIDLINKAQHELRKHVEDFLLSFQHVKKEVEKTFREYDKLFRQAEDIVKTISRNGNGSNGRQNYKVLDNGNTDLKNNISPEIIKLWKQLNKPREIRPLLDLLNEYSSPHKNNDYLEEETSPLYFVKMAEWLQQRFPKAEYENVIGLCKLANITEIEEQDYSLNPGRYVGVVIEEDGLTQEEFEEEIKKYHIEFINLNASSNSIVQAIEKNLLELFAG